MFSKNTNKNAKFLYSLPNQTTTQYSSSLTGWNVQKLNNIHRDKNVKTKNVLLSIRKSLTNKVIKSKYLKMVNLSFNLSFNKSLLYNLSFQRYLTRVQKKYWLKSKRRTTLLFKGELDNNPEFYKSLQNFTYKKKLNLRSFNKKGQVFSLPYVFYSTKQLSLNANFQNTTYSFLNFSRYFFKLGLRQNFPQKFIYSPVITNNHLKFIPSINAIKFYLNSRVKLYSVIFKKDNYILHNSMSKNKLFNKFLLYSLARSSNYVTPLYKKFKKHLYKKWQTKLFFDYRQRDKKTGKIQVTKFSHPLRFRSLWLFKSKRLLTKQINIANKKKLIRTCWYQNRKILTYMNKKISILNDTKNFNVKKKVLKNFKKALIFVHNRLNHSLLLNKQCLKSTVKKKLDINFKKLREYNKLFITYSKTKLLSRLIVLNEKKVNLKSQKISVWKIKLLQKKLRLKRFYWQLPSFLLNRSTKLQSDIVNKSTTSRNLKRIQYGISNNILIPNLLLYMNMKGIKQFLLSKVVTFGFMWRDIPVKTSYTKRSSFLSYRMADVFLRKYV